MLKVPGLHPNRFKEVLRTRDSALKQDADSFLSAFIHEASKQVRYIIRPLRIAGLAWVIPSSASIPHLTFRPCLAAKGDNEMTTMAGFYVSLVLGLISLPMLASAAYCTVTFPSVIIQKVPFQTNWTSYCPVCVGHLTSFPATLAGKMKPLLSGFSVHSPHISSRCGAALLALGCSLGQAQIRPTICTW